MKVLSLWQPWAHLIAVGAKRVETRSWAAPPWLVGERIAIQATKTRDHLDTAWEQFFRDYLIDVTGAPRELPLGAVICTCVLDRCTQMTEDSIAELERRNPAEHAFGLYTPGRWAWVLRDVIRINPPIPFKGTQNKFDEIADDLVGHTPAQASLL